MKSSFVLHLDSLDILDELTKDQIAELFLAIRNYNNNDIVELDAVMKMVFLPFKNQFIRDGVKYKARCEVNSANGLLGGRPKKESEESEITQSLNNNRNNPTEAKKGDSVSDSVSDSEKDSDIYLQTNEYLDSQTNNTPTQSTVRKKIQFVPPTVEQVISFCLEKKYTEDFGRKIFSYYEDGEWKDSMGKKVVNWKQKINSNWFKPENDKYLLSEQKEPAYRPTYVEAEEENTIGYSPLSWQP